MGVDCDIECGSGDDFGFKIALILESYWHDDVGKSIKITGMFSGSTSQ